MSQSSSGGGNDSWTRWMFGFSLLFTLGAAGYFGHQGSIGIMWSAIAAGVLGMLFCRLNRIGRFVASFKGGSIELETMQREIAENTATIERIKSLAIAVYRPILGLLAAGDRFGGGVDKSGIEDQIIGHLRQMGASEAEIEYARTEMDEWKKWDHAQNIEWACREMNNEISAALNELKDFDRMFVSEPSVYHAKLEELGLLDEYTEAAIEDYEYFLEHKRLRRRDRFCVQRADLERMNSGDSAQ